MPLDRAKLARLRELLPYLTEAEKLEACAILEAEQPKPGDYAADPVGFCRDVLGVKLWHAQEDICRAVLTPPGKVICRSGHKLGKSLVAACLALWWYYSHNPGLVVTIAPRAEHLRNILWKEIRIRHAQALVKLPSDFIGPAACEMRSAPDHLAIGITASKGESLTGRHDARMLYVIDEAVGVDPIYYLTIKTMFRPGVDAWLCLCNPTDTTCQLYAEETSKEGWQTIALSSMEHPNITGFLDGTNDGETNLPIPNAVRPSQVDTWVADWTTPADSVLVDDTDLSVPIEWRGKLFRPGPDFESRVLGLWPSQGTAGVWSEALWKHVTELRPGETDDRARIQVPVDAIPEIGCDIAGPGEDDTAIHVRWGNTSFHHESANGWKVTHTVGRLIELARQWAEAANAARRKLGMHEIAPEEVPIKLDDDTLSAVTSILQERGFNSVPVRAARVAFAPSRYPNKRSELWFAMRDGARVGLVWLGRLPKDVLHKLRLQFMAPTWKLDSAGRRVVEKKDDTKDKIGRSPDDADAANLAFYPGAMWDAPIVLPDPGHRDAPTLEDYGGGRVSHSKRRKLFGR